MPRYVLLRHDCPPDYRQGSHWDLMLEHNGALRTWSLMKLPGNWAGDAVALTTAPAVQLADHRIAYLDYEGEIAGGRGAVSRSAAGEFRLVSDEPDRLEVEALSGELQGHWTLERDANDHWLLKID